MIWRLALAVYAFALRVLNLGERRCGWCQKFLGWRRGLHGQTTHGICAPCKAKFEAASGGLKQQRRKHHTRRPLRKTLRRQAGGWSGAVARRGRASN